MTTHTDTDLGPNDLSVSIETNGDDPEADAVHRHVRGAAVEALQAVETNTHPAEVDAPLSPAGWGRVVDDVADDYHTVADDELHELYSLLADATQAAARGDPNECSSKAADAKDWLLELRRSDGIGVSE